MSTSELYTLINKTIEILAWPVTAVLLAWMLRAPLISLLNRFTLLEGSVGSVSFKVSLEEYFRETVSTAVNLEREGRTAEAQALVKNASNNASLMYGLSDADIAHLISLADGAPAPSRWGKIHLVRAGLVELDGGSLTPQGREFVEGFIRPAWAVQRAK
jgi:hypothetical protein